MPGPVAPGGQGTESGRAVSFRPTAPGSSQSWGHFQLTKFPRLQVWTLETSAGRLCHQQPRRLARVKICSLDRLSASKPRFPSVSLTRFCQGKLVPGAFTQAPLVHLQHWKPAARFRLPKKSWLLVLACSRRAQICILKCGRNCALGPVSAAAVLWAATTESSITASVLPAVGLAVRPMPREDDDWWSSRRSDTGDRRTMRCCCGCGLWPCGA